MPQEWDYVSSDARDFISALMQKEPSRRSSASQALNHKWMMHEISEGGAVAFNPAVLESLESFAMSEDIKKARARSRTRSVHALLHAPPRMAQTPCLPM